MFRELGVNIRILMDRVITRVLSTAENNYTSLLIAPFCSQDAHIRHFESQSSV